MLRCAALPSRSVSTVRSPSTTPTTSSAGGTQKALIPGDPEHADRFWINPVGVSFRQMTVSHLVQVSHDGEVLLGNRPINPVGFRLHAAVHAARPDVNAVCHAHSLHGKAWSSLGRVLDPITQDSAVFFEQQALITTPRVALNQEQGKEFAVGFGDKRARRGRWETEPVGI